MTDIEKNSMGQSQKQPSSISPANKKNQKPKQEDKSGYKSADDSLTDESEPVEMSENESNYEPLVGKKVKKSGLVTDKGDVIGRLIKGKADQLDGKSIGEHGVIKDQEGNVIGQVEPVESEKKNPYPWVNESSPEVRKSGKVLDHDDNLVGTVDRRAAGKMDGFKVDDEGNIVDHEGNIVGKAEMLKKEEVQEEAQEDKEEGEKKFSNPYPWINEFSPEVKKSGKVFDKDDNLVGTVDKRAADKMAGFKVDDEGNIIDHDGNIVGKAEMIKEEVKEEEGEKKFSNPYPWINEFSPEVRKSGKVVDNDDNVIGSVEKRAADKLAGFKVDDEGNIISHEGNIVGKAELFKEEAKEEGEKKFSNPYPRINEFSPEVKSSGKVLDKDDNIVGSVEKHAAHNLVGFKVDDEGNIINHEGNIVGKAEMYKEKTDEEKQKEREEHQKVVDKEKEEEEYRKLANLMSNSIQQSLDKIKPVLKMITENIEAEEAKPSDQRDEQKLVENVKPLIEQASNILSEADGAIRGLDPTGKIAKTAQAKTSQREASPEEYHLADLLSQLTGEVTTTIDKAKKKVKNMPHAKKALSPLWNVLQSPLLQILSAVGLLLTGVLGLVGNLLNGLGLGSILNSLLGGIGLNKILEGFGLGKVLGSDKK
ncbi:hypothetical protein G6F56_008848 [Rhizopus delemar]|uniref:DUF6987 domain-containing protein n=1 Tax=Rhizopus stolonifer TaxID=4846 RepID=A0A367IXZ7_RHIST|nr:hypothetical protein G6F56_008848 [Rhizopus delemar]RCH82469.1 hypothetical protein CU098_003441 [Rhizopus stolonifer]